MSPKHTNAAKSAAARLTHSRAHRCLARSCLALSAAGLAVTPFAVAQDVPSGDDTAIGEMIVTAQKRRESSNDVGMAISALSGDALATQRVSRVMDLAGFVPNLDIKEQVPGAIPVITIRGVGLNDFGAANNPSAGVYIDQVYVASIAMMSFDFYDLERIEVLKGPQGTLYGRNSTAGAINIITRKPQQSFEAYTTLGYGNYDTIDAEGALNVPLGESAAMRVSARSIQQSEGFWESRLLPGDSIGERDILMGRVQFALAPTDAIDVNLKVDAMRSRSETGPAGVLRHNRILRPVDRARQSSPATSTIRNALTCLVTPTSMAIPYKGDWARNAVYDQDNLAATLTIDARLGELTLTSVTGYVDFDRTFDIDSDATPAREVDFLESDDVTQFSQELRLAGETRRGELDRRCVLFHRRGRHQYSGLSR